MVTITQSGGFDNLEKMLKRNTKDYRRLLEKYGKEGVSALAAATPIDSGATASAWDFEIVDDGSNISLYWVNNHLPNGFPVALTLQYGHGTRFGGRVEGQDYINPALAPIIKNFMREVERM